MNLFIELTLSNTGKKALVNVSQAQTILELIVKNAHDVTHITGINNNGGIKFRETYKEIKKKLEDAGVIIIS
jgi:hypothetical protein